MLKVTLTCDLTVLPYRQQSNPGNVLHGDGMQVFIHVIGRFKTATNNVKVSTHNKRSVLVTQELVAK